MQPLLARAIELHEQGQLREAAAAYVEVLRGDPRDPRALHLLGRVMLALGHPKDALGLIDRSLEVKRRDPDALSARAEVYVALGRMDEAIEDMRRVLRLRPESQAAWTALAVAELGRGRGEAAEEAAKRALPGVLASIRLSRGDRRGAVRAFAESLVDKPDRLLAIALADAVFPMPDPPADLGPALVVALSIDGVDHSRLDRAVRAALDPVRDDPARLTADPLFALWLSRSTPTHPDWEPALIRARRWLLDRVRAGEEAPLDAIVALGVHAWATEYAWPEEDVALLDPANPLHVAARAMFAPIPAEHHHPDWEWGPLAPLVRVTWAEPAEELAIAGTLTDHAGDDPTNVAMRAMYEENPYPRVVSVHCRPGNPFRESLRAVLPEVTDLLSGPVEVLVAGCGTGRHLLQSALAWSDATVLGIDLSLRSLARAVRIARQTGVTHVSVARADLLTLDLGRQFDVVEAVGVLHHLADPLAGWRVLRDHVRPGGWMRIGLYSAASRTDITAARALIAERGLEATPSGIREARRLILALEPDHPARPVVWSPDFASLSGCRDLLFHVREHVYTLDRLEDELEALGLELLGFQHALPNGPDLYRSRWPDDPSMTDLSRWEQIERDHPRLFAGMYVFWARWPGHDVTGRQES